MDDSPIWTTDWNKAWGSLSEAEAFEVGRMHDAPTEPLFLGGLWRVARIDRTGLLTPFGESHPVEDRDRDDEAEGTLT